MARADDCAVLSGRTNEARVRTVRLRVGCALADGRRLFRKGFRRQVRVPDSANLIEKLDGDNERIRVSAKRRFVLSAVLFFVVFYFALPLLIGLTSVLDTQAIGALNLAYIYTYAQFVMILVLGQLYLARAKRWDELDDETKRDAAHKGVEAE